MEDYIREDELISKLKPREAKSHKGNYGRIGIIGGSAGMSGSVYLAAMASLRTGSGLVYNIIPRSIENIMEIKSIENIIKSVETSDATFTLESIGEIIEIQADYDVLAIGPGMGRFEGDNEFIYGLIKEVDKPMVIDADGLNAISVDPLILKEIERDIIITPHVMEMSRLCGYDVDYINSNREDVAVDFANEYGVVVVLKGNETIVTDGTDTYINRTGNPGMATAGSGDALTGIIVSFLGQGYGLLDAGKLGVYIHGLAGDFAKYKLGQDGMIARDIVDNISYVLKELKKV